jgi:hypothetical protein
LVFLLESCGAAAADALPLLDYGVAGTQHRSTFLVCVNDTGEEDTLGLQMTKNVALEFISDLTVLATSKRVLRQLDGHTVARLGFHIPGHAQISTLEAQFMRIQEKTSLAMGEVQPLSRCVFLEQLGWRGIFEHVCTHHITEEKRALHER